MGKKNKKNKANVAAHQGNKAAACNGVDDEIPPPPPPETQQISVSKPPPPMSRQLKQEVMELVNQLLESMSLFVNYFPNITIVIVLHLCSCAFARFICIVLSVCLSVTGAKLRLDKKSYPRKYSR